jgi:adhesin transport system outer membrane protein
VEVNFTQEYKSDGYTDTGIKELLVEKKGTDWKIIKETWMPANSTVKKTNATDQTQQIKDRLATWLRAWKNKDVNTYISLYSDNYKTSKNKRIKWRNSRLQALKANKNLSIQASNLQIAQYKNIIELNFIQNFNSDQYSDVGIKELVWINDGSDWKILKETWMSS